MDKLEGQAEKQGLEQEAKGMMGGGGGGESGGENKAVNEAVDKGLTDAGVPKAADGAVNKQVDSQMGKFT